MAYNQIERAYDLAYAGATDSMIAEALGMTEDELEDERRRRPKLDRAILSGREHSTSYDGKDFGRGGNPSTGAIVVPAKIALLRAHGLAATPLVVMSSPPTITMNAAANANSSVVPANYDAGFAAGNAAFTYVAGYSSNQVASGPPGPTWQRGSGSQYGTGNGYQGNFDVYFATDATDVDLSFYAANNFDCTYRISIDLIDGNGFRATNLTPRSDIQTLGDFSAHRVKIANGSTLMRRYRIECDTNLWFAGLDVTPGKTLTKYDPGGPVILVTGDSHVAATGATSRLLGMSQSLKFALGVPNVMSQGQGGTGYLMTGVAGTQTMRGRIAGEITPRAPDLIIDLAGYNDSPSTAGQLGTEAALYYAALTAALPAVPVIKVGPPRRGLTGAFTLDATKYAAIKAAVLADSRFGSLVFSKDTYAADWEHGTGRVGATTGDGNADTWVGTDNVHRTDTGHAGWAALLGPAIRAAIISGVYNG